MLQEIYKRFTALSAYDNLESICRKMNAEFNACFYQSKGSVWTQYTDEQGKSKAQKLSY